MSEALTIPEELTRKALDHLENSYLALEQGKIGMLEFKAIVETLFAVCSGLTDREFFEIISQASAEVVSDNSFAQYELFKNDDDAAYLLNYKRDRVGIDILSLKINGWKVMGCPVDELSDGIAKITNSLRKRGFERVKL